MTENAARTATRTRACGALDGENLEVRGVAADAVDALMRAHAVTIGLHTAQ